MAKEFVVKKNKRKTKRDINKVFSNNLNKILTEIILNADDSYKRLESQTKDKSVKEIIIDIKRKDKKISVTDYAEGLSAEELRDIFSDYGGQHSRNKNGSVRGLFGQGASDVLFFGAQQAKLGKIESIKDEKLHICKFIVGDEKKIKVETITNRQRIKGFKDRYSIENNATVVSFGIGNDVSIPHKSKLTKKIEKFYMLRYVFSDPLRHVIIKHDGIKETVSSQHLLPENDQLVMQKHFDFVYDSYRLKCHLKLFEDSKADSDERVLITDPHKIVYDNTLFGLEEVSGANRLRGELIIDGIYDCLNDYLNNDNPTEILRDSRDGFDQREDFTKKLFSTVKPYVKEQINLLASRYEPKQLNMDEDKTIKNMLSKINQYYRDLKLEEIGTFEKGEEPPNDGIRFVRERIHITKRKTYGLKMLINANMFQSNAVIKIDSDADVALDLVTRTLHVNKKEANEYGLIIKTVVLKGKQVNESPINLEARCTDYTTYTNVNVVEETIVYPDNGLEFIPKEMRVKPDKAKTLHLYVDTNRFSLGTDISVERSTRSELFPENDVVKLQNSHLINEDLGKIPITFKGGNNREMHHYKASADGVETKALIRVEQTKEDKQGLEGLFSGLEGIHDSVGNWQSKYDHKSGKIQINLSHPIHKTIMPSVSKESIAERSYSDMEYSYIFELVALECSKQIVDIRVNKNEIEASIDIAQHEIQKYKTDLYKTIIE